MEVKVTSIGDINLDLVSSNLDKMPDKDSQVLIEDFMYSAGGCATNFAKATSTMGLKTRLIGKIGADMHGVHLREELNRLDLRLSSGSKTGLTVALSFTDGSRSFITYPGSNSELSIEDIDFNLIEGGFLHVASFFLQGLRENTSKLLKHAHKNDMICSFDTGWDPSGWGDKDVELVIDTLKDVDIFFPNRAEAEKITGEHDVERLCDTLLGYGPGIISLKTGSRGCVIATKNHRLELKPYVVDVVDSTGAGDVFAAGFIYAQSRGLGLYESGDWASAAAAISTRAYGSLGYPTPREVSDFLANTARSRPSR